MKAKRAEAVATHLKEQQKVLPGEVNAPEAADSQRPDCHLPDLGLKVPDGGHYEVFNQRGHRVVEVLDGRVLHQLVDHLQAFVSHGRINVVVGALSSLGGARCG